jgi:hypothetical protein
LAEHSPTPPGRRSSSLIIWGISVVSVTLAVVGITNTGVDVLVLVLTCLVLLVIERTLGDWMGELLGSGMASLVFTGIVALVVWYAAGSRDRSEVQYFFAAAEARGYQPYFWVPAPALARAGAVATKPTLGGVPIQLSAEVSMPVAAGAGGRISSSAPATASRTAAQAPAPPSVDSPHSAPDSSQAARASELRAFSWNSLWRRLRGDRADVQRNVKVTLVPAIAVTGQPIALHAVVTDAETPVVGGAIEFAIDGRPIEVVAVDRKGEARSTYSSRIPGRYTLQTRFTENGRVESEALATLYIIPGK